ncbi:hypothetical protein BRC81_08870 [Halobacteriales archaeon QS_1_68_20]|nr:MAG: hypothetical protein BRC81_08870 [Halobacteriales archaeon QS_1_68_20]
MLEPGESFVASSRGPGFDDAGLYVFPDEAGRSVAPYEDENTPAGTPTPGGGGTPTPDATPGGTTGGETPGVTPTEEESTPGFGPLAATSALGTGA